MPLNAIVLLPPPFLKFQLLIPLQNKLNLDLKHRYPLLLDWSELMYGGTFWVGLWRGWYAVDRVVVFVLGSRSLRCPPQVQWSPDEGSPEGMSYLGQVGEGSG